MSDIELKKFSINPEDFRKFVENMKDPLKKKINETADRFLDEDAPKYGLTKEEVKESAKRMIDPEYRKKIHDFAKMDLKKI